MNFEQWPFTFILNKIKLEYLSALITALITLFVPLAILILGDYRGQESGYPWERNIFLKNNGFKILLSIILSFLTLSLWDYGIKQCLTISFCTLVTVLVLFLKEGYHWITDDDFKHEKHLQFLKGLSNPEEIQKTWSQTWRSNVSIDAVPFAERFKEHLLKLWSNETEENRAISSCPEISRVETMTACIHNFRSQLQKRAKEDPRSIKIHFETMFAIYYRAVQHQNSNETIRGELLWLKITTESALLDMIQLSGQNDYTAYLFFHTLQTHLNKKDIEYIKKLLSLRICTKIFESFDTNNFKHQDYFPQEWRFELDQKKPLTATVFLNCFINWFLNTIQNSDEKHERAEGILEGLYPFLSPIIFVRAMLFWAWHPSNTEEWNSFLERAPRTGAINRNPGNDQTTYQFLTNYFKSNQSIFKNAKTSLEKLKYESDAPRETHRLHYLEIISQILNGCKSVSS